MAKLAVDEDEAKNELRRMVSVVTTGQKAETEVGTSELYARVRLGCGTIYAFYVEKVSPVGRGS